jgi:hypothetical protein
VNVDVKCTAECEEWEIHSRIDVLYTGYFDWGPNLWATVIGLRAGIWGAIGANVALGGAAMLQTEYRLLQGVNEKAGTVIQHLLQNGPTAMCMFHANAR